MNMLLQILIWCAVVFADIGLLTIIIILWCEILISPRMHREEDNENI